VVASEKSAEPETAVDTATGVVVRGSRVLSEQELAAQYEHVLHAVPDIPGHPAPPPPRIVALYAKETQRQERAPQTALTQNVTIFVLWLAIFWPRLKLADLPIRGMADHAELVRRTVQYLEYVGVLQSSGDGAELTPGRGLAMLRLCLANSVLWEHYNAALLLAAVPGAPSKRIKHLLVRLAWLAVRVETLVDEGSKGLSQELTDVAANWLGSLNQSRDPAGRMKVLAESGHIWALLAAFVQTNAETLRGAASTMLNPKVAREVWEEIKLRESEAPLARTVYAGVEEEIAALEESCRILSDEDMRCVWDVLSWAYQDKTFFIRRRHDGTYSAMHGNSKYELNLRDKKEYLDYLFGSVFRGATVLSAFTTHFISVEGTLRPHNISARNPALLVGGSALPVPARP
jgi:hypothetical protein